MRNKTLAVLSIVMWAIVGLCGLRLMIYLGSGGGNMLTIPFFSFGGVQNLSEERAEVILESVEDLDIEWEMGSVTLLPTDEMQIRVLQRYGKSFDPEKFMVASVSGNKLTISAGQKQGFGFDGLFKNSSTLRVYLPKKLYNNLRLKCTSGRVEVQEGLEFAMGDIRTSSGSIRMYGTMETANLQCTSGSVTATNPQSKRLTASATSGSLRISGTVGDCELTNTSGSIRGEDLVATKMYAKNNSGGIYLAGLMEEIECKSSSGSIRMEADAMPRAISTKCSSGGTSIALPENSGFTVNVNRGSGGFRSDFSMMETGDRYVYGDGSVPVECSSGSGGIRITKN